MTALLETRQLDVSIVGQAVCRDLTLVLERGQCWGLLGRNGVGKTTLLHTLAGLRAPAGGAVTVQGVPLSRVSRRHAAQRIAVLLQEYSDAFPSSVLETALIGRHPHLGVWQWEGAEDLRIARQALAAMELDGLETRMISTLSGGERRRLEIAAVLTQTPQVLLLDEPTNHLDLHHQIRVLDILAGQCRGEGKALLMSLHDINLAARYCDHLLLLYGRGETLWGAADEVLTEDNVTRLYHYPIRMVQGAARGLYYPE